MNRRDLKESLLDRGCEGQEFKPHICTVGLEMNEVVFPRYRFQHKKKKSEREYFWNEVNVSMNCKWFHMMYGHTTAFKEWHMQKYDCEEFIRNAPLKVKV